MVGNNNIWVPTLVGALGPSCLKRKKNPNPGLGKVELTQNPKELGTQGRPCLRKPWFGKRIFPVNLVNKMENHNGKNELIIQEWVKRTKYEVKRLIYNLEFSKRCYNSHFKIIKD